MKFPLIFFIGLWLIGCTEKPAETPAIPTVEIRSYYPDGTIQSIGNYTNGKQQPASEGLRIYALYSYGELVSVIDTLGILPYMTPAETGGMIGYCTPSQKKEVQQRLLTDYAKIGVSDLQLLWSAQPLETGFSQDRQFALYAIQVPSGGTPLVDNQDVYSVEALENLSNDQFRVDVTFVGKGLEKVAQLTKDQTGRSIAMAIGNAIYAAPKVMNTIGGRVLTVADGWTKKQAKELERIIGERILNGKWRAYHPNGKLKETGTYNKGLRVGSWTTYDQNGKRIRTVECAEK